MLKKLIIEKEDEYKMLQWDKQRLKSFVTMVTPLEDDTEQTYVISLDIADKDSEENSVMCVFKIVNREYYFDRCDEI